MTHVPNPYPGAKPLGPEEPDLLLGRDDLLSEFVNLLRRHAVVEVAGPSGVGKSSFLSAGLCGRVDQESDLIVRSFSAWSELPDQLPGTVFYAEALNAALRSGTGPLDPQIERFFQQPGLVTPSEDPDTFVEAVNTAFGDSLVVIFDQLEELLRDEAEAGREFLENVRDVASWISDGFTQVVSLRDEYSNHLKVIEEHLDASLWTYKVIKELGPEVIPNMVRLPLSNTVGPDDSAQAVRATRALVRTIQRSWVAARRDTLAGAPRASAFDEGRPGLLHVQAFLFAMFTRVDPKPGSLLSADAVAKAMAMHWPVAIVSGDDEVDDGDDDEAALEPIEDDSVERAAAAFWPARLEQYVQVEMDNRRAEFAAADPDDPHRALVAAETTRVAVSLPDHLSAAGYKLVRGTDELAATVLTQLRDLHSPLKEEIRAAEALAWDDDGLPTGVPARYPYGMARGRDAGQQAQALAVELARECRSKQSAGVTITNLELAEAISKQYPGLRNDWGDDSMVSGRMGTIDTAGGPSAALRTACEMVITYERAIQWLETSGIIRLTQTRRNSRSQRGARMAAIVHDGFGRALMRWSVAAMDDPVVEVAVPISITGKQVFYRPELRDEAQALTPDLLPTTERLGWIGCNVTAYFKGITLKDCDLRSTLFMRCRFVDVTFEDCLTHGLLFIDCEFEGTFTVRSTGSDNGLREPDKLKTLTFGFGCRTADDGSKVLVEGMAGYGLFFDGYVGRWEVHRSAFSHLVVNGSRHTGDDGVERACGPGRIIDSPEVRHVVIGGEHPHRLEIAGVDHEDGPRLDAPAYLEAPGIDVVYERGDVVP